MAKRARRTGGGETRPPRKRPPRKAEQVTPQWVEGGEAAIYADFVHSSVNERSLMFHFGQVNPDNKEIISVHKVVLHPKTAGELLAMLAGQIRRYEERFSVKIAPEGLSLEAKEEDAKDAE